MATLTFSPPIIKLALLILLVIITAGVGAWIVWKDVKGMAEKAERSGYAGRDKNKKNIDYHPMNGHTNGIISNVKAYDHARTDQQIKDDYANAFENDPGPKSYPISKNKGKNKKCGPGKGGNYNNYNRNKGGGAR